MNQPEEAVISERMEPDLPSPEDALRSATLLAQTLRRMHQEGAVCGGLNPNRIVWSNGGATLLQNGDGGVTPYTAPEQLLGESADARSDIFAFGAIVYELLSGRKAFPANDPEELKREILELEPGPLPGVSDGISRVLRRCLEKKRENRWQRMSSILIELKLAGATARSAQQLTEWKEKITSLRSQIAGLDSRLTAYQVEQELAAAEVRQSIGDVEAKADRNGVQIAKTSEVLPVIQESVAGLQKATQIHDRAIEAIEAGISQTDEVVEHVVDAFGSIHKSMVERAEAKVLSVSRNGN
jgi:eukaryotic-like serine/threonine-protein kinase